MADDETMTWLILEDDEATRDVIQTMCELWEFPVLSFDNGHQAIAYLQQTPLPQPYPDVALLDIRNPGPWGHEVSAHIRQHPLLHDIGIIIMTAYELPGNDEQQLLEMSGADQIIFKPLPSMNDLLGLVQAVLRRRSEQAC